MLVVISHVGCLCMTIVRMKYVSDKTQVLAFSFQVYKTSILVFKDRDKYVSGEFRFRHGYCKSNPRKMVRTWAEKEMRNLSR